MNWEVIHTYTRKQAIEDGVLVDISDLAGEAGFQWHTAMTANAFNRYVVPPSSTEAFGQSAVGRLWDVLSCLRFHARPRSESVVSFKVSFLSGSGELEEAELKAVAGPGDQGEPVVTIMLPSED